jgi:hypothetical protein
MLIDTGVLGYLVDPGLERDRLISVAQAAQSGDEHLLGDILSATMVGHPAADEGRDPLSITGVELLEGAVVPVSGSDDQLLLSTDRSDGSTEHQCHVSVISEKATPYRRFSEP